MNYYVYWCKNEKEGRYQDDVGIRYDVSVINELDYNLKSQTERQRYKLHWAGNRFVELSGLKELFPSKTVHNIITCNPFTGIQKRSSEIAVVLTTWKRTDRLGHTLEQIKNQTFQNFDLYIINNNPELRKEVEDCISHFSLNITLYHSEINLGFVNRHILSKNLNLAGYPYVIVLDDDLDIKPNSFAILNAEKSPKSIKSILALNFKNYFYDQTEEKEAQPSKYIGPGGMICDSSLFVIPEFWDEWGLEYYLIDDFWVSYFARKIGWECGKSLAPMTLITDGNEEVKTYKKNSVMLLRNDFVEKYKWTSLIFKQNDSPKKVKPTSELLLEKQKHTDDMLFKKLAVPFMKVKAPIIFDVGACECEDSVKYAQWFPKAKVYAFEPVFSNYEKGQQKIIEQNLSSRVSVFNYACGDINQESEIYVSSGRPNSIEEDDRTNYGNKSSSLMKPKKHLEIHPWCRFDNTQKIKVIRLEEFCKSRKIEAIDFLHLDVQGFEKKVLIGLGVLLKATKAVYLEVENLELYEGQPLKNEIEKFMKDHRFVKVSDTVGQVSGDQLWINKEISTNKVYPNSVQWR